MDADREVTSGDARRASVSTPAEASHLGSAARSSAASGASAWRLALCPAPLLTPSSPSGFACPDIGRSAPPPSEAPGGPHRLALRCPEANLVPPLYLCHHLYVGQQGLHGRQTFSQQERSQSRVGVAEGQRQLLVGRFVEGEGQRAFIWRIKSQREVKRRSTASGPEDHPTFLCPRLLGVVTLLRSSVI